VDQGETLDRKLLETIGGKLYQYKSPQSKEDRPARSKPDLGAYEFAPKGR